MHQWGNYLNVCANVQISHNVLTEPDYAFLSNQMFLNTSIKLIMISDQYWVKTQGPNFQLAYVQQLGKYKCAIIAAPELNPSPTNIRMMGKETANQLAKTKTHT